MQTQSPLFSTTSEEPVFIFIDGSYFCFHRYFSILRWWKNAHPEEPTTQADTIENPIIKEKFVKTFIELVKNIPMHLGIPPKGEGDIREEPILFVGKDCKREEIWRNALQEKYKGTRVKREGFKPFIQMVYEDNLFDPATILSFPQLEADDCIALSVKYILKIHEKCRIYIMTSDKDYLQLMEPRVKIFDLSFKNIAEQKSCMGDAKTDLFCKIVMGDTSDNIPSVLKKCGPKTALKCYQNAEYFQQRMTSENAQDKFDTNQKMIDFNYIPTELVTGFYKSIGL